MDRSICRKDVQYVWGFALVYAIFGNAFGDNKKPAGLHKICAKPAGHEKTRINKYEPFLREHFSFHKFGAEGGI